MITQRFEVSLAMVRKGEAPPAEALILILYQKVRVSLRIYDFGAGAESLRQMAVLESRRPLDLKWHDSFELLDRETKNPVGSGAVLNPLPSAKGQASGQGDRDLLLALAGNEKDMIEALCRKKGIRGLRERDIELFCRLSRETLQGLSEDLEEEGKVKILAFAPLLLISWESFAFIGDKVVAYLEQHYERRPTLRGVPIDKVKQRFHISERILQLAVRTLEKAGRVRQVRNRLALPSRDALLSPHEEKILQKLEEMCYRGEFQSVSLKSLGREFRLSAERLDRLLSVLTERRKVVQGPEGLFIHARWLDDIVSQVRALGKKDLTVADFKAMTGLSRKYAIPLLELLDQMGVTRRKGPTREIL
jgi:selenocysteine-specific elongation factor